MTKTNEEIARELVDEWDWSALLPEDLESLVTKALAERVEECAKICDNEHNTDCPPGDCSEAGRLIRQLGDSDYIARKRQAVQDIDNYQKSLEKRFE